MELIKTMNVVNNVILTGFSFLTRNTIMPCYVSRLTVGHTLLCKGIQTRAKSRYLRAVADLSCPAQIMNPIIEVTGKQSLIRLFFVLFSIVDRIIVNKFILLIFDLFMISYNITFVVYFYLFNRYIALITTIFTK